MTKIIDTYKRHHDNNYYGTWGSIKSRCYNKNNKSYQSYGARGITVCDRWLGKDGFKNFMDDMGVKPTPNHTLDRIDNNKGYTPDNCRWATYTDQLNNRRNSRLIEYMGKTQTLAEWSLETGIGWHTLRQRIDRLGWSIERALTQIPK